MIGYLDPSPNELFYCTAGITINWTVNMCSTLFLLSMTFDRFYSIIRPHKAASFNTVKRAKITIGTCVMFSITYNSPHIFISSEQGGQCIPYGRALRRVIGQFYYWLNYATNFVLPFILLLVMNSFIINAIRQRSKFYVTRSLNQGQSYSEGQNQRPKKFDGQVFAILLLVTFSFLILITPTYLFFIYTNYVDYEKTAKSFAEFYLLFNIVQKMYYTNFGVNFYLYVMSGQKFRKDLMNLFKLKISGFKERSVSNSSEVQTRHTSV